MIRFFRYPMLLLSILTLFGCQTNEIEFNEILKGEITKISSRNAGNGLLYTITDQAQIAQFNKIMSSTTYSKADAYSPVSGNSSLELYNGNNLIISITSNGKGTFKIGNGYYKMNHEISADLASFYKSLYTDENIEKL